MSRVFEDDGVEEVAVIVDVSEEEREDEREVEDREVGTLLEGAWVSVVRSCVEGMTGVLVDLGRE